MSNAAASLPEPQHVHQRVAERAQEFSLPALLTVLRELGIDDGDIHFASHPSMAPATCCIWSVTFTSAPALSALPVANPRTRVEIVLNSGFFSATSPLAGYLRELANSFPVGCGLRSLLAMLDDAMLHERVHATQRWAEQTWRQWPPAANDVGLRDLATLDARWSLDWLFRQIYPELMVCTGEAAIIHERQSPHAKTGSATLGWASLGGFTRHHEPGFFVHLIAAEPTTALGQWWPDCAKQRFSSAALPRLGGQRLRLDVMLTVHGRRNVLRLESTSALGFEPLGQSQQAWSRVEIFSGIVGG